MRGTALVSLVGMAAVSVSLLAQPKFGARVDLVVVSAVVRDDRNSLVRALTRDDFEVIEDGKPVAVSTFAEVNADALAPQDDGRFIVLLLDNLVTDPTLTPRIKDIARGFTDRMGRGDVMSVVYLNGGSSTTTRSATEVRAAIDRFKPFGTSLMGGLTARSHAMESVAGLAKQLAGVSHRRKVLVCIGPANVFNVQLGDFEGKLDGAIGPTLRDTARADMTTYVIDPGGLKAKNVASQLDGFARETGGVAFANVNVFAEAIDQVWQESGAYYLLGYERAQRDERRHTIEVRVKRPGLQVRARRTRG